MRQRWVEFKMICGLLCAALWVLVVIPLVDDWPEPERLIARKVLHL